MHTERRNLLVSAGLLLIFGLGLVLGLLVRPGPAASGDGGGGRAAVFENPLRDVRVGEWARYRLADGKSMTLTVLETDPLRRFVRVREEWRDPGTDRLDVSEVRTLTPNHFLRAWEDTAVIGSLEFGRVRAAGRTFDGVCVTTMGRGTAEVRHWYSSEVPVAGLVLQEQTKGATTTVPVELEAWGPGTE